MYITCLPFNYTTFV